MVSERAGQKRQDHCDIECDPGVFVCIGWKTEEQGNRNKYIKESKMLGIFRKHKPESGEEFGKLVAFADPPKCESTPDPPPVDDGIRDKILYCITCEQPFIFAAGEARFYRDKQISETRRCPSCRMIRREQRRREREGLAVMDATRVAVEGRAGGEAEK
jgi:hypothetical protein